MYCYRQFLERDKAEYVTEDMTWERWSIAIIDELERKHTSTAIKAMYYQDGIYMTWTAAKSKTVKKWIESYKRGAAFPYSGTIDSGESFTIVFDRDCEIVDNIRARETRAQYNKDNAAELAAARGEVDSGKAAAKDYKRLKGDNWTTAELRAMLDNNPKKIKRLVDKKLIERVTRGCYRRKKS